MEELFDLQAYLLGDIYPQMSEVETAHWSIADAEKLAADLKKDGIQADPQEVFETIAEFISQDTE